MKTHFPSNAPTYANVCLDALVRKGLGKKISLGGGFGLLYYLDYRPTNDVDAWWAESATPDYHSRGIGGGGVGKNFARI
jgi:hypothetical protein